jgi:AcrR family transcriptional regulator
MTGTRPDHAAAADQRSGKRERLTAAAIQLLHRQGVERTTLADIAKAAGVPNGGVYYYFKTKDEIVTASIEVLAQHTKVVLAQLEASLESPKARLKALVADFVSQSEAVTRSGCPFGSLCSELGKREDDPTLGAVLLRLPLDWAEQQFRALGREDARDLAIDLLSAYEGSALLANTFRDPEILIRAAQRVERWIDAL